MIKAGGWPPSILENSDTVNSYVFITPNYNHGLLQTDESIIFLSIDIQEEEPIEVAIPNTYKDVELNPEKLIEDIIKSHDQLKTKESGRVQRIINANHLQGKKFQRQFNNVPKQCRITPAENTKITDEIRAYDHISRSLQTIFYTVEPSSENLSVYGHEIRNLLIVACTEAEHLLKSFLIDNNFKKKKGHLDIRDFAECNNWLQLHKYAVSLRLHPDGGSFSPFKNWGNSIEKPDWYESYNLTKHNRVKEFSKGSLKHLIDSVAAIHILIIAQWGDDILDTFEGGRHQGIFITHRISPFRIDYQCPPIIKLGTYGFKYEYNNAGCFDAL